MASGPRPPGGGGDAIPGATRLLRLDVPQASIRRLPYASILALPRPGAGKAYVITRMIYHSRLTSGGNIITSLPDYGLFLSDSAPTPAIIRTADIDSSVWSVQGGNFIDSAHGEYRYYVDFSDYSLIENAALIFGVIGDANRGGVLSENQYRRLSGSIAVNISYGTVSV